MDMGSSIKTSRNLKHSKKLEKAGSSIRISDLPDPILQHILSFLPTKYAVRTSVLSRRWQYLWMYVTNLMFKEGAPDKRTLFMDFVDKVLMLCDSSDVNRFSLSCDIQLDARRVYRWLCSIGRHKIQELHLDLAVTELSFVLPACLFTCDSLMKLHLSMYHILKLPSCISFKSLRFLSLSLVVFAHTLSTQQLFSGCPLLEKLSLIDCSWKNVGFVCISNPMLHELS